MNNIRRLCARIQHNQALIQPATDLFLRPSHPSSFPSSFPSSSFSTSSSAEAADLGTTQHPQPSPSSSATPTAAGHHAPRASLHQLLSEMERPEYVDRLVAGIKSGHRLSISRALTLLESLQPKHTKQVRQAVQAGRGRTGQVRQAGQGGRGRTGQAHLAGRQAGRQAGGQGGLAGRQGRVV